MLVEILKWTASFSGMIAAMMVAADLGRRITGWGFVLFGINLIGIYRYLIRKKPPRGAY